MIQIGAINYAQAYDRVWVVDFHGVHHVITVPWFQGQRAICGEMVRDAIAIVSLGRDLDGRAFCAGCLRMV